MSRYRVTNMNTNEVRVLDVVNSIENAIWCSYGQKTWPDEMCGNIEYYTTLKKDVIFKLEKIPEVTLNYEDIIQIIECICIEDRDMRVKVGSAQIEYLIFKAIRDIKQMDFFKEEQNDR
jgi:hypothetical protein